MTIERAYERLVAANPVPDVERHIAASFDLALDDYEIVVAKRTDPVVGRPPAPRLLVAAAAFLAVVLAAVAIMVSGLLGGGDDAATDEPVGVVNTFFDRWNEGDVDRALAVVSPDVLVNGGFQSFTDLRGLMLYASEFEGGMRAVCAPTELEGSVSCSWAWTTPSAAALGIPGAEARRFQVVDGMITALATPSYAVHEQAISGFAQEHDPAGFAAACDPESAVVLSAYGFPFDSECGAFLAALEDEFIASLGS